MNTDRAYGGVIWTNHALQRLKERGISQADAYYTFKNPHQSRFANNKGAWIYYRIYNNNRIEVVAKKNEENEWLILSVWSKEIFSKKDHNQKHSSKGNIVIRMIKALIDGVMR